MTPPQKAGRCLFSHPLFKVQKKERPPLLQVHENVRFKALNAVALAVTNTYHQTKSTQVDNHDFITILLFWWSFYGRLLS